MLNTLLNRESPAFDRIETCQGICRYPPPQNMQQSTISLRIAAALLRYTQDRRLGCVLHAPGGMILSRMFIRPDIVFVSRGRSGIIGRTGLYAAPDLIVDLLPSQKQEKDLSPTLTTGRAIKEK
jgi:Uma2 family endonuclease